MSRNYSGSRSKSSEKVVEEIKTAMVVTQTRLIITMPSKWLYGGDDMCWWDVVVYCLLLCDFR